MNKNIALVVAGSGEIRDLEVGPGTKVKEVLAETRLDGYLVSAGPDQPFLGPEDDLYQRVPDGTKVYASTPAEAGRR